MPAPPPTADYVLTPEQIAWRYGRPECRERMTIEIRLLVSQSQIDFVKEYKRRTEGCSLEIPAGGMGP